MRRPHGDRERLFRTGQVSTLLGVSRRQLQYWAQTDLVCPSAQTPGGHHRYTFEDVVALGATKQLIDAGVSVQRIRGSIQRLRQILPTVGRPLSELVFVATGDVVLVLRQGTGFQTVLGEEWVFEVAALERRIEARSAARARPHRGTPLPGRPPRSVGAPRIA